MYDNPRFIYEEFVYTSQVPRIEVIYPHEGIILKVGYIYQVRWLTYGFIPQVNVSLYLGDCKSVIIEEEYENCGFCNFNIFWFGEDSSSYRVLAEDAYNSSIFDFSDYFTINIYPVYEIDNDNDEELLSDISSTIIPSVLVISLITLMLVLKRRKKIQIKHKYQ